MNKAGYTNIEELECGKNILHRLKGEDHEDRSLSVFSDFKPDLVLLDVVMPGINGFEVCRALKARYPLIPVVLISSLDDDDNQISGYDCGADAYTTKPVHVKKLTAIIKGLLKKKHIKDDLKADYENLKNIHKSLPPYVRKNSDCIGDYSIASTLGTGSTSLVYDVKSKRDGKNYALKILKEKFSSDPENIALFRKEIENIMNLKNESIIEVTDYGFYEGFPFLVMAKFDGICLSAYLENFIKVPLVLFERIALKIASALDFIHEREIIHRDVKLENILIDDKVNIKIIDFGLAVEEAFINNETDTISGTPLYIAPEIINGMGNSRSSDVYALGIVLYQLVTGVKPFKDESIPQILKSHCFDKPARVDYLDESIPKGWADFIELCLDKNPALRPLDLSIAIKSI